jgi:hypothetical protein
VPRMLNQFNPMIRESRSIKITQKRACTHLHSVDPASVVEVTDVLRCRGRLGEGRLQCKLARKVILVRRNVVSKQQIQGDRLAVVVRAQAGRAMRSDELHTRGGISAACSEVGQHINSRKPQKETHTHTHLWPDRGRRSEALMGKREPTESPRCEEEQRAPVLRQGVFNGPSCETGDFRPRRLLRSLCQKKTG